MKKHGKMVEIQVIAEVETGSVGRLAKKHFNHPESPSFLAQ